MLTPSKRRANDKHLAKYYEQVAIRVRKGTRDTWKQQAELRDMSLASLIQTAVTEYLETHPTPAEHPDTAQP